MMEAVRKHGWPRWAKVVATTWCVLVVMFVVIGIVAESAASTAKATPTSPPAPTEAAEPEPEPQPEPQRKSGRITFAMFEKVESGMTLAQVQEITGSDGELMSEAEFAGFKSTSYQWANWGGSNMIVMFQNGRVTTKAQAGLR